MGVVQWHAEEHFQGRVSLLACGVLCHIWVVWPWGQNALLLLPKTVGFTLMHDKIIIIIKNCCNRYFTKRSGWCYPVWGWFLLMILLEREWKERLIYKSWVVPKFPTPLITLICSKHLLAKKRNWSISSHQMMLIQSELSQWCEVAGLIWHWDMQQTRGGKQNHEGGWSKYKEEGRWVVFPSRWNIRNPLQAVHVTDVVLLVLWTGTSGEVYSSLKDERHYWIPRCWILQFLLLLACLMLPPRGKNLLP